MCSPTIIAAVTGNVLTSSGLLTGASLVSPGLIGVSALAPATTGFFGFINAIAPVFSAVSTVSSLIPGGFGTVINGVSTIAGIQSANAQADFQQQKLDREATLLETRRLVSARQRASDERAGISRQVAAAGASGFNVSSPSFNSAFADTAGSFAEAQFIDNLNTNISQNSIKTSKSSVDFNASVAKQGLILDFGKDILTNGITGKVK